MRLAIKATAKSAIIHTTNDIKFNGGRAKMVKNINRAMATTPMILLFRRTLFVGKLFLAGILVSPTQH